MMTIQMTIKRITAVVLALAVVLATVPWLTIPFSASAEDFRVADPSTMHGWKEFFGQDVPSTHNAGGVWTDKSVFTDANDFDGTGITMSGTDNESFLVALSAIASNKTIEGLTSVPTDTVFLIDVSGDAFGAAALVETVNRTAVSMLAMNPFNRVGVVAYAGGENDSAKSLLSLGRYVTGESGQLLSCEASAVTVDAALRTEQLAVPPMQTKARANGAYMQEAFLQALQLFETVGDDTTVRHDILGTMHRKPVLMLAADSAPTVASTDYTVCGDPNMDTDTIGAASVTFATQLTASYVKQQIANRYHGDCLWYAASQEDSEDGSLLGILDPLNKKATEDVHALWTLYNSAQTGSGVLIHGNGRNDITRRVEKSALLLSEAYVDAYVANKDISEVCKGILEEIEVSSHYFPTLVEQDEELSGYISFVDKIGSYMSVTDIKGILIDNVLFSGALLSENFVTGGGSLGTYESPTPLGDELVWAVKARLGVDADTARGLIGLAYTHGQLSYDAKTGDFSNYIGWYANAAGEYLGFWYDGIETMPDPTDPTLNDQTRPAFVVRSYGFLGAVNEEQGVTPTDMMYATVQIRENLLTGEESVVFAVPASLVPVVNYEIALDNNGKATDLYIGGAEHPIRLVYEVALDEEITPVTVTELVEDGYAHQNADGTYDFYTNPFESDDSTGYGKVNTYSYFTPSFQNERYYYTEDSLVYADQNGTPFLGATIDPHGEFYRAYTVYSRENGATVTKTMYERISVDALTGQNVEQREDGYWYVVAGKVHHMLDEYVVNKVSNPTESLSFANVPFVDTMYTYYVGATLGNNGRLTVIPETGIAITSTVQDSAKNETFTFSVESADTNENATYDAVLKTAYGETADTTVRFENGVATVVLGANETLYITDMAQGASYTVRANAHDRYAVRAVNGEADTDAVTLAVTAHRFADASFDIMPKGFGDVVIIKRIEHDLGSVYRLPDKQFELRVSLGAAYAGETVEASYSGDSGIASVTADENGEFTVMLKNTEQFALKGLLEGTVVAVTEQNVPDGFEAVYYGAGVLGQNHVVVAPQKAVSIIVNNRYTAQATTDIPVTVGGSLTLLGREDNEWTDEDIYTVELQKHNGTSWETIASATVQKNIRTFDFTDAMTSQVYTAPGLYSYQVLQTVGTVSGVVYDRNIHTFTFSIGDPQMNGQLEVLDVMSHEESDHIHGSTDEGFVVTTDFVNTYETAQRAVAVIDVNTALLNPSMSDLANRAGFSFGLYEDGESDPLFVSALSDMVGEARIIASFDTVGSYSYTLRQIVPSETVPAMTCSDASFEVTVTVDTDINGVMYADVAITQNGQLLEDKPCFVNAYEPVAVPFAFPVTQQLFGRALNEAEFITEIRSGDEVLASGTHDTSGTVTFDNPILLDTVTDYYFDIVTRKGDKAGITYDTFVYRIHAHVTDNGDGTLGMHAHVINVITDEIVFIHHYQAAPVQVVIEGVTTLLGREMVNDEFAFLLTEQSDYGLMMSTRNYTDGAFRFGALTYTSTGTFRYTLSQMRNTDTHYILFDDTVYELVVEVSDDGDGQLSAAVSYEKDGDAVSSLRFVNRYEPTPVPRILGGEVTLTGDAPFDVTSELLLCEADEQWNEVDVVTTAQQNGDGSFAFDMPPITQEGVYRYLIKQANGGQTIDGITYDDEVYHLLYVVTDNHRGTLQVKKSIFDGNNDYTEVITFVNAYNAPTTTTTVPTTTTTATSVPTGTTTTVPTPVSPQTGETSRTVWPLVLLLSAMTVAVLSTAKKRYAK